MRWFLGSGNFCCKARRTVTHSLKPSPLSLANGAQPNPPTPNPAKTVTAASKQISPCALPLQLPNFSKSTSNELSRRGLRPCDSRVESLESFRGMLQDANDPSSSRESSPQRILSLCIRTLLRDAVANSCELVMSNRPRDAAASISSREARHLLPRQKKSKEVMLLHGVFELAASSSSCFQAFFPNGPGASLATRCPCCALCRGVDAGVVLVMVYDEFSKGLVWLLK